MVQTGNQLPAGPSPFAVKVLAKVDIAFLFAKSVECLQSRRTGDWEAVKKARDIFYEIARRVMAAREQNPLDPEEDSASSLLEERNSEGKPLDKDHLR
ncbi:hypothetical protein FQN53_008693 [Emmonsiellopsis sp. PD_33]|nr:hypothetical protein FQN53_008693 [Emmonsiellopsis sp. PD_33]